ncbi:hypothetical protein M569_06083, partial [Genlisea aurea]
TGTVIFSTVDRQFYGFDVFSVGLTPNTSEQLLTDGVSVNFNAQFADDVGKSIVFISERTGAPRIFLLRDGDSPPQELGSVRGSLFHDRPIVNNGRLYFISAHELPGKPFRSWTALYSVAIDVEEEAVRLSPPGCADYSPAISKSGEFIAVASYGNRPWGGEFQELHTDIAVFRESDPQRRILLCEHGGWPSWCGDSVLYFHRKADDGWWAVFRIDLPEDFIMASGSPIAPVRVTPTGIHCFTPAAMHDGRRVVVATRRKGSIYRHIEIYDVERQEFTPVTELYNPNFHHYNPFVSPEDSSTVVGYHRFRGKGAADTVVRHLEPITSPIQNLGMLRINGTFPTFSPSADLISFNHKLIGNSVGLHIVRSDGSKRWTLLKNRVIFGNSWSPTDNNVIFTTIGPIFESAATTVQIARVTFQRADLSDDRDEIPVDIKFLTKENTGNNAFPSCSPDGKSVVFRSGRSGHKNLFVVDALEGEFGGDIRQLTDGPWIDTMPCWSPDGKLIAFSSNRHTSKEGAFGIYLINSDGSGLRRVKFAGSDEERERLNHVCFSPDSEWLLFTSNFAGVTAEPVSLPNHFQPYGDLYTARLDGSGLRRLTFNGYENGTPAWDREFLQVSKRHAADEDELEGQFEEPLWLIC